MYQKKPLLPVPLHEEEQQLHLKGAGAQAAPGRSLWGVFILLWKTLQGRRRFLKQGVRDYRTSQQSSTGKLQVGTCEVNFHLSEIKILHILVLNKWTKSFFFLARRACPPHPHLSGDPVTLSASSNRSLLYINVMSLNPSSSLDLENHPPVMMFLRLFTPISLCALL